jgi:hypothetical protein
MKQLRIKVHQKRKKKAIRKINRYKSTFLVKIVSKIINKQE